MATNLNSEFGVVRFFLIFFTLLKYAESRNFEISKFCTVEYRGVVCKEIESSVGDPAMITEFRTDLEVIFEDSKLTVFPTNTFRAFPSLEQFHLNNCGVRYIRISNFQNSTRLKFLDLSSNSIASLPSEVFMFANTLVHLLLSHNELHNFEWDTFRGLSKLQGLFLNNNKITKLPRELFEPLPLLREIYLGNNQIEVIEREIFYGNPLLEKIDLKDNYIKAVERRSLTEFKNLIRLDVSKNMFEDLETGNLLQLHAEKGRIKTLRIRGSISHLYGNDNNIQNISISNLSQAKVIQLRNNSLFNIRNLGNATEVRDLDVSQNPINEFTANTLVNMTKLQTLNLSSINIKYLHDDLFLSQSRLEILDLSKNFLEKLEFRTIKNMRNLRAFYFDDNKIDKLDYLKLKDFLPSLREIGLSRNPWNCTQLSNVLEYLEAHNIHPRSTNRHSLNCSNFLSSSYEGPIVLEDYSLESRTSDLCRNTDSILEQIKMIKMVLIALNETWTSKFDTIMETLELLMQIDKGMPHLPPSQ